MDKNEANKRLAAIESEAKELRAIINAPEQQKPKPGDVWCTKYGSVIFWPDDLRFVHFPSGTRADYPDTVQNAIERGYERLGTFDEVYVERSKVDKGYVLRSEVREIIKEVLDEEDAWTDMGGFCYTKAAMKARDQLESLL